MGSSRVGLLVSLCGGILIAVVAFSQRRAAQAEPEPDRNVVESKEVHAAAAIPEPEPVAAAEPAPVVRPVAIPVPERKASVRIRDWQLPAPPSNEKSEVEDLAFDRTGGLLVCRSGRAVTVFSTADGKLLHSIRAPNRGAVLSRDGRFVAVPSADEVSIYSSATGRRVTGADLAHGPVNKSYWSPGAFSASGEYLLMGVKGHVRNGILAIPTRPGPARPIVWPEIQGDPHFNYSTFASIPRTARLLFAGRSSATGTGVHAFNFNAVNRTVGSLTGLGVDPWPLIPNRGMRVSNDGSRMVAHTNDAVAGYDLLKNASLFRNRQDRTNVKSPVFTPDGKYCLHIYYPTIYLYDPSGSSARPDRVFLLDAVAGKKLASFDPAEHGLGEGLTAIEVSHDGKTLAVAAGRRIALFDMEGAFGRKPAAPIALPTEAEKYPFE